MLKMLYSLVYPTITKALMIHNIFYPCNRSVAGKKMKTEREVKVELFLKMSTSRTKNGLTMTTSMFNQSWKAEMTVRAFQV